MGYLDPREWSATSVFGWGVHIDIDGLCAYRDGNNQLRASYPTPPAKYPSPALGLREHTISLPDGDVVLFNGIKGATRRASHNGHLLVHERRYEFHHKRRGRCEVWCDGSVIATLRGRRRGVTLVESRVRDDTDVLVAVLCEFAVKPGRPNAVDSILTSLSI